MPDTLEVIDCAAFHDLLESDDLLVAVHYNIDYSITGEPAEPADDLFLIRLMDGADELGSVVPYPYYNDGYAEGITALYWSAAAAPAWEGVYTVEIQGSPVAWGTPPDASLALGDWSGFDGPTDNQQALYEWMIDAVQSLETNWTVTLLESTDAGTVLNETGTSYLTGAITGLQALCPDLFWIRATEMDTDERAWGTGQADLYEARFDGTWVGDGLDGVADMFGVTPQLIGGLLFVLLPFLAVVVLCERSFFTSTPALIALPLLMGMAALLGFFSMWVFAIAIICFVLLIGYVLFFRTS